MGDVYTLRLVLGAVLTGMTLVAITLSVILTEGGIALLVVITSVLIFLMYWLNTEN